MTCDILRLKKEICDIGQRMWQKGFCSGSDGNLSARVTNDRILCTPTGISKGFLKPPMITLVDMDGNQIDKRNRSKRTSEVLLHLQIYKTRPDIRAVIHSHAPHATAFACSGVPVPEGIHPEADFFLGKIRTTKYTTPGYEAVGRSACELIQPDTTTVLLGNHGAVSFSSTLLDAYHKLEMLDGYCRMLLMLKQLGRVNLLTQEQMLALLHAKKQSGVNDSRLDTGRIAADNGPYLSTFTSPPDDSPL